MVSARIGLVAAFALSGCSLVLDPDELVAASADATSETSGETRDATSEATVDTTFESDASDGAFDSVGDTAGDTAVDTVGDSAPGPEVIVRHSGAVSCILYYRLGLTQCPETCGGGWTYVVDASSSTGVGTFAWTFAATEGFSVSPRTASGARVELTLEPPDCLVGGTNMVPFEIVARLSTDGGPAQPVELPSINPGFVTSCASAGDSCPAP